MAESEHQSPEQYPRAFDQWLECFEAAWRTGSPPDIRRYLADLQSTDLRYLANLIQLDLEYRWKQYRVANTRSSVDEHGFPLFPKLEDYAARATVSHECIFTPEMLAEEYRVRLRWGDAPDRDVFFSRVLENPAELDAALNRVETELKIDRATPSEAADSSGTRTTVGNGNPNNQTAGSPSPQTRVPRQLDRYRLESLLGRGGFGEVWEANDPKLDRRVAIKVPRPDKRFPPEVIADFEKEAQKLAKLGKIPGIVTVYDTGTCEGHTYMVSELIEGESLDKRNKRSTLSHQEIVRIVSTVAEAVHRAHLRDLIHRDIKPGNILLNKDGSPVVADFGLAVTETEQLTESPRVVGTLAYMPPEQVTGNSHLAHAQADIYSLGVVLYQLLTGRLPFVATTFEEYREQITNRPPRSPRTIDETIPKELERICLRCLQKRPEDRYPTARDLASELQASLDRPRPKRGMTAVVSAACLILVGLLLAASFYPWKKPDSSPASSEKVPPIPQLARENLLDRPPEKLVWDSGYELNSKGYLEKEKRFSVRTAGDAVFLLGQNTSSHFTFRVRFAMEKPGGRFGLMWGHEKKQQPNAPSVEKAHSLLIQEKVEGLKTRLVELTFSDTAQKGIRQIYPIAEIKHSPAYSKGFELEVEVEDGAIKNLRVQDSRIDIKTSKPVFQQGNLGVLFTKGYFVVTEAWYHNKEKNNAKVRPSS